MDPNSTVTLPCSCMTLSTSTGGLTPEREALLEEAQEYLEEGWAKGGWGRSLTINGRAYDWQQLWYRSPLTHRLRMEFQDDKGAYVAALRFREAGVVEDEDEKGSRRALLNKVMEYLEHGWEKGAWPNQKGRFGPRHDWRQMWYHEPFSIELREEYDNDRKAYMNDFAPTRSRRANMERSKAGMIPPDALL